VNPTASHIISAESKHAELAERIISRQVGAAAPAVSPDGGHIAYVVTRVDQMANKYRSQVWLAAADGSSAPRPLRRALTCPSRFRPRIHW
jgi:dipeptidyl aminopeptidase/acylaminoacyl peptidase